MASMDSYRRYAIDDQGEDVVSEWANDMCMVYCYCIEEMGYDSDTAKNIVENGDFRFYEDEAEYGAMIFDFFTERLDYDSREAVSRFVNFKEMGYHYIIENSMVGYWSPEDVYIEILT